MMRAEWIEIDPTTEVMNVPGGCVFRADICDDDDVGDHPSVALVFVPMVQAVKGPDGVGFVSTMAELIKTGYQMGQAIAGGMDETQPETTAARAVCSEPGCNSMPLPETGKCAPHSFSSAAEAAGLCGRCDGCGKIADGEEGAPWSVWESMPLKSSAAVLLGIVKPITCPDCGGTGKAVPR